MKPRAEEGKNQRKPAEQTIGTPDKPKITNEQIDALANKLGLNDPAAKEKLSSGLKRTALWHRLDINEPDRTPPAELNRLLEIISRVIDRLNTHLSVDAAGDLQPSNIRDILDRAAGDGKKLRCAIDQIQLLKKWTSTAREPTVDEKNEPHHKGDLARRDLFLSLIDLHEHVFGIEFRTSVHKPEHPLGGIAYGRCIDFISACLPLFGIEGMESDAIRSAVRRALVKSASE